jgi:outer membrane cobalamin receptor
MEKSKHLIFFIKIILPICICQSSFCQNKINGKIVDADSRQPLEYATVAEGTANGNKTTTDQYGNFSLSSKATIESILISSAGYTPTIVKTEGRTELKIDLQPDVLNLKDVVVLQNNSATKFSTLAKIDLDLKPVRNTQELLRLVPGLFIAQHAGGGKAEQIFLRGFDCDHGTDVQVSVDGMPVNMVSHAHGQGYADAHFIIPETINNIDFGAGPYYTQHGNLNTAGYVSFGTYTNIPTSRVQIEAGRFDTYRGLAMIDLIKKNKDKQSAWIASEFNYTNGPTDNKQFFKRFNIFGKYNLAISNRTQFTASISSFSSKWDASGQVPERAVESGLIDRFGSIDPSEGGNTERHNANFLLAHKFANGAVWENQAFYSRYKFSLYSNFTFYLNDTINGDEINQAEERNVIGYLSKISQQYNLGSFSLQSIYGGGFRYDATQNSQLANVVKRQFLRNTKLGDIKETNGFAYVQQQLSRGKWLIDAGVRLDYFHFDYFDKLNTLQQPTQSKSIVSPKINIQYTVSPKIQLYVKSGKGFHSNDTRVVVANNGKEILPAAYGSDIGIILKPTSKLLINIAAWYLHLNQEFVYVGDDGNIEPSGKSRREGIDVIARYQFSKNIFANLNLNFTKPRAIDVKKGEDYIPLAPVATSTGGLFYKATKGFNGSVTYRYIKSRPANEDNSIVAKGYFLLDASLNYTQPKYEIGLAMENLLNVKWNEAQFATTSRLRNEIGETTELNFTPGTPFFIRLKFAVFF